MGRTDNFLPGTVSDVASAAAKDPDNELAEVDKTEAAEAGTEDAP